MYFWIGPLTTNHCSFRRQRYIVESRSGLMKISSISKSDFLFELFYDADNLLLTANQKSVKLADFGLAREESVTEMMTAETGTYRWMAPEVCRILGI